MHIEIILAIIFFILAIVAKAKGLGSHGRHRKRRRYFEEFEERDYLSKLHDPTTVEGDVFYRVLQDSWSEGGFLKGPIDLD